MNCIYACNRNLPHHSSSLSLSLFLSFLLCLCSASLRLLAEQAKRAEGHLSQSIHDCSFILWAMATTIAQTLTDWGEEEGKVKGKGMSRSHCCRQWTRVRSRISISVFLWFPVQFSVLTRIIEQRGCGKRARNSCAHFTHNLSLSLSPSLFLLLYYCMWQF